MRESSNISIRFSETLPGSIWSEFIRKISSLFVEILGIKTLVRLRYYLLTTFNKEEERPFLESIDRILTPSFQIARRAKRGERHQRALTETLQLQDQQAIGKPQSLYFCYILLII